MLSTQKTIPASSDYSHASPTHVTMSSRRLRGTHSTVLCAVASILLFGNTAVVHANSDSEQSNSIFPDSQSSTALGLNQKLTPPIIEHCESLVTHLDPVVITPLRKPPHMKLFRDPAFTTKNRRITNSITGQVYRPLERSAQSWNSDESLLLLSKTDENELTNFVLLDGSTYQSLGNLNISTPVNNSVYWSQENPLSVLYVAEADDKAGQLLRFDIATGTESLIKDFAPYCEQNGLPAAGGQFPKPSSNDDLFSYQCGTASEKSLVISYRYITDEIHTVIVGEGSQWNLDHPPVPTLSGNRFVFQGFSTDDTLKNNMVRLNLTTSDFPYQVSKAINGNDVVYQLTGNSDAIECSSTGNNATGLVQKQSLPGHDCESFVTQQNSYSITSSQSTLFVDAEHAPDWAAMSYIGYEELESYGTNTPAPTLFSELFLVNAGQAGNQEICRIAHHRTFGKRAQNASYDPSLGEPVITLSPSGTRVLFSSDWYDSGSVDTFVVELPSFTRLRIDGEWADNSAPNRVTRFVQAGAKFAFSRAAKHGTGENTQATTGTGRISGKQIDLSYVTTVANQQVPGKCVATVQRDIDNLIFTCDDDHFGSDKFAITRQ